MDEQYQDEAAEIYGVAADILTALVVGAVAGIAAITLAAWAWL